MKRLRLKQNSVWNRTIPMTAFVFTPPTCYMTMRFLNIRWKFIMGICCDWTTIDTFFISIHPQRSHDCKSRHLAFITCQDRTMLPVVKRFPKTHIPSHSFTEGLSGLSALSFSPPFLPPLIVLLNRLAETCRIRVRLFPYQKVRYHHGSYWWVIIMTRIILVLFDKFDWGLIEIFL